MRRLFRCPVAAFVVLGVATACQGLASSGTVELDGMRGRRRLDGTNASTPSVQEEQQTTWNNNTTTTGSQQEEMDSGGLSAEPEYGSPRFTWEGCECRKSWHADGNTSSNVTGFCANPDVDPLGEWCFVFDVACQGSVHWGYCAPPPRCVQGTQVIAEDVHRELRAATVLSLHGTTAIVRFDSGSVGVVDLALASTALGEPCFHTRPASITPAPTSTMPPAALPESTTGEALGHVIDAAPAAAQVRYDFDEFGPPLALRLTIDFDEVLLYQVAFVKTIREVVATIVQQPVDAVQVLDLFRGSVILALGVVPSSCGETQGSTIALVMCHEALADVRHLWSRAVRDPSGPLQLSLGRVDLTFPAFLGDTECDFGRLPCSWTTDRPSPSEPRTEDGPWWAMSLIGFLGTAIMCIVLFVVLVKGDQYRRRVQARRTRIGATQVAVTMPRTLMRKEDLNLQPDWTCLICLGEECEGTELILLPCKHFYHCSCALEWFRRRLRCPICRNPILLQDCSVYAVAGVTGGSGDKLEEVVDVSVAPQLVGKRTTLLEDAPSPELEAGSSASESPLRAEAQETTSRGTWIHMLAFRLPNAVGQDEEDDEEAMSVARTDPALA
eukprot:CAMPEP_0203877176 /NCGR_PEP_ID=MMETSP0359-20131031/21817_1 /ASSEMBLY_ACC=CAM_ASM_000338 /TAXON_ID=268821 /ORGANISM="Scrippsiella Hangoei, Strain SHTV-5" /LENGTH=610 /DNA_ID=CAMNT_0050796089 /DNA_START=78 /DNA_END=1910 /DNA_ORIENTATION=-